MQEDSIETVPSLEAYLYFWKNSNQTRNSTYLPGGHVALGVYDRTNDQIIAYLSAYSRDNCNEANTPDNYFSLKWLPQTPRARVFPMNKTSFMRLLNQCTAIDDISKRKYSDLVAAHFPDTMNCINYRDLCRIRDNAVRKYWEENSSNPCQEKQAHFHTVEQDSHNQFLLNLPEIRGAIKRRLCGIDAEKLARIITNYTASSCNWGYFNNCADHVLRSLNQVGWITEADIFRLRFNHCGNRERGLFYLLGGAGVVITILYFTGGLTPILAAGQEMLNLSLVFMDRLVSGSQIGYQNLIAANQGGNVLISYRHLIPVPLLPVAQHWSIPARTITNGPFLWGSIAIGCVLFASYTIAGPPGVAVTLIGGGLVCTYLLTARTVDAIRLLASTPSDVDVLAESQNIRNAEPYVEPGWLGWFADCIYQLAEKTLNVARVVAEPLAYAADNCYNFFAAGSEVEGVPLLEFIDLEQADIEAIQQYPFQI